MTNENIKTNFSIEEICEQVRGGNCDRNFYKGQIISKIYL